MAPRQRLGQRAPTDRRRLTKLDAPDPAGASTDRSNPRRRLLGACRKRAGLACESARVCVDVQSIPSRGLRTQSAPSFASPTTPPETCRRCRRSFPNNSLQSCVMARAAMGSSWPVGACPDRPPMEARRSPTSAGLWTQWTGVCGPTSAPFGGRPPVVRFSHDGGHCDRRAHPSEGDARNPDVDARRC